MRFSTRSIVLLYFFAIASFGMVSRHPQFALFSALDVAELVLSGMCLGIGTVALIANLRANALKGRRGSRNRLLYSDNDSQCGGNVEVDLPVRLGGYLSENTFWTPALAGRIKHFSE